LIILLQRSGWSTRSENAAKFQKNSQTHDFDLYEQCKDSHGKGNPREIGCFQIQMHVAATVYPGYCTIRLFLFDWQEIQLAQRI
jgi:hypothetical protein